MHTITQTKVVPVPVVGAPGGDHFHLSITKSPEGHITIMTQPIGIEQKPFVGDRYERFREAIEILAEDENVAGAELPFNGDGLRALAADLIDARALDGLTDSGANWLGMLIAFDFCRGLPRFGWRINDMFSQKPTFTPNGGYDNEMAVVYAYVKAFRAILEPFAVDIDEANETFGGSR